MRLQLFEQDIGWDLKNDVWNEEDSQRSIVFSSVDYVQVFL
jgi:hypothetical protein